MVRRVWILMLALLFGAPVFAADEALVIYSGRSDKFVKPVIEAFTRETGIPVILHSAKSTALLNKLRIEGPRTQADLYISNDAGNLQLGSDMGLFAALPDDVAGVIDARLRAPDNTWVGLSARARVLVVNTDQQRTGFVHSVFDLADPRLKGRLGITNSSNESFIAGTTVYMIKAGVARTRHWLEGMRDNVDGQVFNKHSKIVAAVAAGKKDIGLVNHYYIYRHLAKHPDASIRIVLPDQGEQGMGVAWNVAGVAVSKYSKQQKRARRLVAYLVSEAGQKIFANVNHEYPTREGVPADPAIPPASSYKVADVPMAELAHQRNATIDLLEAVGMP
ncbi:MAG: extracellular solute-binding protein [Gammaproteobacteria bacterium]